MLWNARFFQSPCQKGVWEDAINEWQCSSVPWETDWISTYCICYNGGITTRTVANEMGSNANFWPHSKVKSKSTTRKAVSFLQTPHREEHQSFFCYCIIFGIRYHSLSSASTRGQVFFQQQQHPLNWGTNGQ